MENKDIKDKFTIIENEKNIFIIFRENSIAPEEALNEIYKRQKEENKILTLIFDLDDLSKNFKDISSYINEGSECEITKCNLIIKNCLFNNNESLFMENEKLELNKLYVSDELHSMSPKLYDLFKDIRPQILILKSIKINSKLQLKNFFNLIKETECQELFLDDFFIELIIKKDNDDEYNDLDHYFFLENGKIFININNEKIETNLNKLKLIDCPLFALTDDAFKDIKEYNDKEIDIDENSLLNPSMVTKFRIDKGLSDFCFDLDSYKLNKEEDDDDYIKNIKYIIDKLINDNNNEYNKLIFKNFDITKYEYITGENLTYIDEKNWILNEEEKARCKKFEEFDEKINDEINKNLNKLSKVKSLVFDNCSNHFIQLILKFINSSKNDLELLKLKKCGKEHFNITNILSLKINNLILFDTPLNISSKEEEDNLINYKSEFGSIENFIIKICSLEQYCIENNLNYYNSLEIILELIKKEGYITNLIFEMNALPIIMTYLIAKEYCKDEIKVRIPTYFDFTTDKEKENIESKNEKEKKEKMKEIAIKASKNREELISKTFNILPKGNSKIILRKNYIKNKLENYDILTQYFVNEKGKDLKIDFGSDVFNLDIDFRQFFILNGIETIILDNCLFTNYTNQKLGDQSIIKETLFNLCEESKDKSYKIDIKTINEVIFKNKGVEDLTYLFRFFSLDIQGKDLSSEITEYLKNVKVFFDNLKKTFKYLRENIKEITIIINNLKERKEFYCLMQVLMFVDENSDINYTYNYHGNKNSIFLPDKEELRKKIQDYFLKEQNEDEKEILSVYNYYYTSDEEKNYFGEIGEKKNINNCAFGNYHFNIEFNYENPWTFIME